MANGLQPTRWLAVTPVVACTALALAAGEPRWIPGVPGIDDKSDDITCMQIFDDGSGPALYVGGEFNSIGGVTAKGIARWNGSQWSSVGTGFDGSIGVRAMKVFDDGSGPALYIGGVGVSIGSSHWDLAKWNGTRWVGVAPLLSLDGPEEIYALEVFDDGRGGGPALYAAGYGFEFGKCCKEPDLDAVAKWNGTAWEPLGEGLSFSQDPWKAPIGLSMTVHDDGNGPSLFVSGWFDSAGGMRAWSVVKWNGRTWDPLDGGPGLLATAMTTYDADGAGPQKALLIATGFGMIHKVFAWDGSRWSAFLPSNFESDGSAVAVLRVGSEQNLYLAGNLNGDHCMFRWDGGDWFHPGGGVVSDDGSNLWALASFADGSTQAPALFVAGAISSAGGYPASGIARWGVPKEPACLPDISPSGGDARINIADLLQVITGWGPCADPCIPDCLSDVNGDCTVNIADLLAVIGHWGPCPGSIWE